MAKEGEQARKLGGQVTWSPKIKVWAVWDEMEGLDIGLGCSKGLETVSCG